MAPDTAARLALCAVAALAGGHATRDKVGDAQGFGQLAVWLQARSRIGIVETRHVRKPSAQGASVRGDPRRAREYRTRSSSLACSRQALRSCGRPRPARLM